MNKRDFENYTIDDLFDLVNDQEQQIEALEDASADKDQKLKELKDEVESLTNQLSEETS